MHANSKLFTVEKQRFPFNGDKVSPYSSFIAGD